jgi:peptidoglycan L-alanyl-D-glutamate endopeptidase CwlK
MSGLIRSLDELDPCFRPLADKYLAGLELAGIRYVVLETKRTQAVQDAYYAQGRRPLAEVNALRMVAGLWAIRDAENKRKPTDSAMIVFRGVGHGNGTAMDVAPADINGNPKWSAAPEIWKTMGEIAEISGLDWGGRWKPINERTGLGWDCAHVQMRREG